MNTDKQRKSRSTKTPNDMRTGTEYQTKNGGALVIMEYLNSNNVKVKFVNFDFIVTARADHIRSGEVKNMMVPNTYGVGYLGIGRHTKIRGTKAYSVWVNMFTRCYNPGYHEKQSTYVSCSVCTEWHNFQNFADWFENNYIEHTHLDKDLLDQGNKVYSPAKCVFVTRRVNNVVLGNKARRGSCRLGVSICSMTGKHKAEYVNSKGKSEYLGLFDTDVEAHEAYKAAKYSLILEVAEQQTNERVKQGLLTWVIPEY